MYLINRDTLIKDFKDIIYPEKFEMPCNPYDVIYAVQQVINQQMPYSQWIPVDFELPMKTGDYLVKTENKPYDIVRFDRDKGEFETSNEVLFWAFLPDEEMNER